MSSGVERCRAGVEGVSRMCRLTPVSGCQAVSRGGLTGGMLASCQAVSECQAFTVRERGQSVIFAANGVFGSWNVV